MWFFTLMCPFGTFAVQEMTLDEYQKILEEKRKALNATKTEERKVDLDKDLESMQQLSIKKGNDDVFIKLVRLPLCVSPLHSVHLSVGF